jgi:hypothetical protein
MDRKEVLALFATGVTELIGDSADSLKNGIGEPNVSAGLFAFLKPRYPGWHCDAEYNRHGLEMKIADHEGQVRMIRPDVVVHRRQTDENLLVVEMKMARNGEEENDIWKLRALTSPHGGYHYSLGVRLVLDGPTASVQTAEVFTEGEVNGELTAWLRERF